VTSSVTAYSTAYVRSDIYGVEWIPRSSHIQTGFVRGESLVGPGQNAITKQRQGCLCLCVYFVPTRTRSEHHFMSEVDVNCPDTGEAEQNNRWDAISDRSHRRFPTVAAYVAELGGTKSRVIEKVLIANNGVGAVKAIRSIRRWAYELFGDERAISFVVMATPEDLRYVNGMFRLARTQLGLNRGTVLPFPSTREISIHHYIHTFCLLPCA
jgi:hypothetical protein